VSIIRIRRREERLGSGCGLCVCVFSRWKGKERNQSKERRGRREGIERQEQLFKISRD
jgi:hypothetical protein